MTKINNFGSSTTVSLGEWNFLIYILCKCYLIFTSSSNLTIVLTQNHLFLSHFLLGKTEEIIIGMKKWMANVNVVPYSFHSEALLFFRSYHLGISIIIL